VRPYLKACLAVVAAVAWLAGTVHPVRAQALGEVARKEEERRKDIKAPAKVYTNKDLGGVPDRSPVVSSPVSAAESGKEAAKGTDDKDKDKAAPQKDQAYWSGRRKELQATLDSDQTLAEALQSRVNALTADFSSRADPIQRSGIERDRLKALGELDRVRKSIQDGKKALADLDEAARKAGVPPGWLR
jgi:ABC-type transporter Mla subunit MlaD